MSLLKLLGNEYTPTAAFSFEFFERTSSGAIGSKLGEEIFFLLPPEEYSMSEGYKVTVTKTSGGGWVDDFGNDFKTLRLSGSLHSYYSGYPVSKPNIESGALSSAKDFVKKTGEGIIQQGKRLGNSLLNTVGINIPGLAGLSGLDEFFKLRWIVSRLRDVYIGDQGQQIFSKAPNDISDLNTILSLEGGNALYDKLVIVYHDYDDNNHYEVIFTNFTMNRTKDDPFTINYTIEMTCMREFKNIYLGLGKVTKKESPFEIIDDFRNTYNTLLNTFEEITNIPNQIVSYFTALKTAANNLYNDLVLFGDNVSANWNNFVSKINGVEEKNDDFEERLFTSTSGLPITDLENETAQLDEDLLNIQDALEQNKIKLNEMKGTEKYYGISEQEKIYNVDDKTLEDTDFLSDQIQKQENAFISRNRVYYEVQQGDTLPKLGNKFYGDYTKGNIIGEANDLKNSDFENEVLLGRNIIIPLDYKSPSKLLDNNLVYYKKLKQATPKERQLQILGNDFDLNNNREIVVDGTGDLGLVYGENCYLENIEDRCKYSRGTLNPIHPNWGIMLEIGNAPSSVAIQRIFENIETQALSDPRTKQAFVSKEEADLTGDTLRIPLHLKPYSGKEEVIDVGDVIAGLLI